MGGDTSGAVGWQAEVMEGASLGLPPEHQNWKTEGQHHSLWGCCAGKRTNVKKETLWPKDLHTATPSLRHHVSPGFVYNLIEYGGNPND